jgi:hypothetical protein
MDAYILPKNGVEFLTIISSPIRTGKYGEHTCIPALMSRNDGIRGRPRGELQMSRKIATAILSNITHDHNHPPIH